MTEETIALTRFELGLTGKNSVSLTEWGTTSEPAMAEGSLLEIGSAIFEAVGGDLDVGDLAALADGIIYLYCADDGTLSASVTAPTWNDDLSGWYDGTSRCYGSILKAGASYTQKTIWKSRSYGEGYQGLTVALGANGDKEIRFATDAALTWDESENRFYLDKDVYIPNNIISPIIKSTTSGYIHAAFPTENTIFDAISPAIPNTNDFIPLVGHIAAAGAISHAVRTNATVITFYGVNTALSALFTITITDGSSSTSLGNVVSIAW